MNDILVVSILMEASSQLNIHKLNKYISFVSCNLTN